MMGAITPVAVATYPPSVQPGIPRLKAPEEGWRTCRLRDLVRVVQRPIQMNDEDSYRLITVKRSRGGIVERGHLLGRDISVKSQFLIEAGDFVISKRQIVHGACAVVTDDFAGALISNEYAVLRCKEDFDLGFLSYLSHSIYFQQLCFHASIGVHIEKMIFNTEAWLDQKINVPCLDQQRKATAALAAVDARIALLRSKRDTLGIFKTGIMNQLLRREVRFQRDNGSTFQEWRSKRLIEFAPNPDYGLNSAAAPYDGKHGYVRITDIDERTRTFIRSGITSPSQKPKIEQQLKTGDILFTRTGASTGKSYLYCEEDGELYHAEFFIRYRVQMADARFVFYQTLTPRFQDHIRLCRRDLGSQGMNAAEIGAYELDLPELDEQKKIADAFVIMDTNLTAIDAQIDATQAFRDGLLQKLLP